MLIRFGGKSYEIEEPLARAGESLIRVHSYTIFPAAKSNVGQMFRFSNSIRKLLFHIGREGVFSTWNKVSTAWYQQKVIGERRLVLCSGMLADTDENVIGLGPADCPEAEIIAFPQQCVARTTLAFSKVYNVLDAYFRRHPEIMEQIFYYDPYSGNVINFNLNDCLELHSPVRVNDKNINFETFSTELVITKNKSRKSRKKFDLFLAGAGVYSCISILPYLKTGVNRHTIIDKHPGLACGLHDKYNFDYKDTSCERAFQRLEQSANPIVVIATYHSTHVPLAKLALENNPKAKVLIEKPPLTTLSQLTELISLREGGRFVEIGYNRRYTDFVRRAKMHLDTVVGPTTVTCIVREKVIPMTHWYYWPSQGTRIVGNLTHWIDLGVHLIGARPISFNCMSSSDKFLADEASIAVQFDDGSQLNLVATDRGNGLRGIQELIDIRKNNLTIKIDDFLNFTVQNGGVQSQTKSFRRDKGHKMMYQDFLEKCRSEKPAAYPNTDLVYTCRLYLAIKEALMDGKRNGTLA